MSHFSEYWDRSGTTIQPDNAGDDLDMGTGDVNAANVDVTGNYQISNNRILAIDTNRGQLFVGYKAGINTQINGSAYRNTAIGESALEDNITSGYNTAIGFRALYLNLAENNTAIGAQALGGKLNGTENTAIGHQCGTNHYDGDNNVFLGAYAGLGGSVSNTYTKNNNTMIGYSSGHDCLSGNGNVFLGYFSGFNETGSNKLYIENSNSADPLIYGEFDTNLVKINGTFQSTGNVTIGAGAAGVDYTLTFDGETNDGVITWLEDEDTFDMSGDVIAPGIGAGVSTLLYPLQADAPSSTLAVPLLIDNSTGGATAATGIRFRASSGEATDIRSKGGIFFERTEAGGVGSLHLAIEGTNDDSNVDLTDAKLTIDSAGDISIANDLAVTGDISATALVLDAQGSAPGTDDGTIYYNSSSNDFQFRENGSWITFSSDASVWQRVSTTISPVTAGDDLDMGSGDITTTGEITGGDLTITSSTPQLHFNDTDDDQYIMTTEGDDDFHIYNDVAGANALIKFFTFDGDGTDTIGLHIFGVGTSASQSNQESLKIEYNTGYTLFQIYSSNSGTGTVRDLRLGAGNTGVTSSQLRLAANGRVAMNLSTPTGQLHVDQDETDGAIPTLVLDQADVSEGFINFIGSDRGVISSGTSSTESVRVEINGAVRRLALYADA